MDEDFKLVQDGFETVTMPEHIEQLWGPVPLPTLPSGVPNTCRVASHKYVYPHTMYPSFRFSIQVL